MEAASTEPPRQSVESMYLIVHDRLNRDIQRYHSLSLGELHSFARFLSTHRDSINALMKDGDSVSDVVGWLLDLTHLHAYTDSADIEKAAIERSLIRFASEILVSNVDSLQHGAKNGDILPARSLRAGSYILGNANSLEVADQAFALMNKNFSLISIKIAHDVGDSEMDSLRCIVQMLQADYAKEQPQFREKFHGLMESLRTKPRKYFKVVQAIYNAAPEESAFFLTMYLEDHGILDCADISSELLRVWKKCDDGKGEHWLTNAIMMEICEEKRPGSCRVLYDEFGITVFGRYPEEMLIAQYDERDDIDHPYGIILNPKDDWSGALYGNQSIFRDLYSAFHPENSSYINTRIIECGSLIELARRLITLKKRYGDHEGGHDIAFSFISGHGSIGSIQFGDMKDDLAHLLLGHLEEQGVKRAGKTFFVPGATHILNSCSTGARLGMAENLSRMVDGIVIGPDRPAHIENIEVDLSDPERPHFIVTYEDDGKTVLARTYDRGRLR